MFALCSPLAIIKLWIIVVWVACLDARKSLLLVTMQCMSFSQAWLVLMTTIFWLLWCVISVVVSQIVVAYWSQLTGCHLILGDDLCYAWDWWLVFKEIFSHELMSDRKASWVVKVVNIWIKFQDLIVGVEGKLCFMMFWKQTNLGGSKLFPFLWSPLPLLQNFKF